MRTHIIVLWAIIAVALCGMVQSAHAVLSKKGTSGYTFLHLPSSARQAALGEAYTALKGDGANAVFSNPALLSAIDRYGLQFSYAEWLADISHLTVSGAMSMGNYGVLGIGLIYLDSGDIPGTILGTDASAFYEDTGNFTMADYALSLSYAKQLTDRFSFGITAKYVHEGFSDVTLSSGASTDFTTSNLLAEVGSLYMTGFNSLRISAFVQNYGNDVRYERDDFKMPSAFRVGVGYDFWDNIASPAMLTVLAEAVHPSDNEEQLSLAGELSIKQMLVFRGGYQFNHDTRDVSAGIGLQLQTGGMNMGIDLAYTQMEYFDDIFRLSIHFEK